MIDAVTGLIQQFRPMVPHIAHCLRHRRLTNAFGAVRTSVGFHILLRLVATILSLPSGNARCSFSASGAGAVIQVSISSAMVRITGIAFG